MATKLKVDLVDIDATRINDIQDMYFKWKDLCLRIMGCSSRKINFPETISEVMVCYALNLKWNKGSNCDAVDPANDQKIEIKASNSSGPTSFSSRTPFDNLIFAKLDMDNDILHIYKTDKSSADVQNIKVNKKQTVAKQQKQKRRPRFNLETVVLNDWKIKETATLNIRTLKVTP